MLYLTETITNTGFDYSKNKDNPGAYHRDLLADGKEYEKNFESTGSFTYIPPPYDAYCIWAFFNTVSWPGWECVAITFDAQTCQFKELIPLSFWSYAYLRNMNVGSLGIMFGVWTSPAFTVTQVDWRTGLRTGNWSLYTWGPAWGNVSFSNVIVNPQRARILGTNSWYLELWDYETPTKLWSMHMPYIARNLAYESDTYTWVLFNGGKIIKVDWGDYRRIEMFSSIATILPEDRDYKVAYDSMRKRLCIFRRKADNTDGSARIQFEFYETVPKAAIITEPVPITSPGKNERTVFVANLIGEAGEGIGGQMVHAELEAPNNHGTIVSPDIVSEMNGIIRLQYQGPSVAGTEKINLSAVIAEQLEWRP